MRRMLLIATLVVGLMAAGAPAQAGTYVFSCGFVFNPPVIELDGEVNILGGGFTPESTVQFFIDGVLLGTATVTDDADGNLAATFSLPAGFDADGEYTVTAECPDGNVASNVLIVGAGFATTTTTTVLAAAPGAVTATPLPVTGSDATSDLLRVGGGLLLLGGGILFLARRRAGSLRPTA